MINLALRSEFSFKKTYGFIKNIANDQEIAVGVADINNTFGHFQLQKVCKDKGLKPIFGVRLMVVKDTDARPEGQQGNFGPVYIFLAKNQSGLKEIYSLVKTAFDKFYYRAHVSLVDVWKLSEDVIVIAENFEIDERIDYIGLSPMTSPKAMASDIPKVAIVNNYYTDVQDRPVYELLSAPKTETQTYMQHLLSDEEWELQCGKHPEAIENTYKIADEIEHIDLAVAPMVEYTGDLHLESLCVAGAKEKGIDLESEPYKSRYEFEIGLIKEKEYNDYFLVVVDMMSKAREKMLVGPGRGSSAGSLVCYLIGITQSDPIEYGLMFERFIDINRHDLPDIDVDFPDSYRDSVIKQLIKDYGRDNVSHIATISKLKPKSAIGDFAKAMGIPAYETDSVKDAIIERSGGDARAQMRILDTFETTEVGKEFIKKYPEMKIVERIEGHANHSGVHAAGIIVCNNPLTDYAGVDSRSDCVMLDKKEAEALNLLKIDVLGLRTLAVLQDCATYAGKDYLYYYNLPLDDEKAYAVFQDLRLSGIFQFEGYALQSLTKQMGVEKFNDIVAITALGRPGPLHSGGAEMFIKRRTGEVPVEYLSKADCVVDSTRDTLGVVIYQEQIMRIGREYGSLPWKDVTALRKATAKSLGEEFFNKYKEKFLNGAVENGHDLAEAENIWGNMVKFGSWAFNKSHAVSYGLISYWTAYAKAHHPLEFAMACMNNSKDEDNAIKILRDLVKNDGIQYIAFDPDHSMEEWTIHEGKLLGGLTTLHGIGVKKARDIINRRAAGSQYTPSQIKTLLNPITPFKTLFPCQDLWGHYYDEYEMYGLDQPPCMVSDIQDEGEYLFIGKLVDRNLRDLNEYQSVVKRGGELIEGQTLFLNMTLEDDTDSIICSINRYKFEKLGREIAESGKIGHDWYLVKGTIKGKWRKVNVTEILNLNEFEGI